MSSTDFIPTLLTNVTDIAGKLSVMRSLNFTTSKECFNSARSSFLGTIELYKSAFSKIACVKCGNSLVDETHASTCLSFKTIPLSKDVADSDDVMILYLFHWSITSLVSILKFRSFAKVSMEMSSAPEFVIYSSKVKKLCNKCKFYIEPVDHEARCSEARKDSPSIERFGETWSSTKTMAWINDTIHRLDVQTASLLLKVNDNEKERFVTSYTSGIAQHSYLIELEMKHIKPDEPRAGSTAFEAMYAGEFRVRYLISKFGTDMAMLIINNVIKLLLLETGVNIKSEDETRNDVIKKEETN